jgi:hypothetical protein
MKGSMQAATAIGIGYVLGRRKKFRTAAIVAAGMTVGGTTVGSLVLKRGMKMVGNLDAVQKVAPQLGDLTDVVRGDLVSAGKAAATAAVSNRVDALTGSLHDRAERVRNPGAAVAEGTEEATETGRRADRAGRRAAAGTAKRAGGTVKRATGRRDAEADEYEDDYDERDDREDDEYDEYEDDDQRDDEDEPDEEAPARRSTARRRSPVSRTRR